MGRGGTGARRAFGAAWLGWVERGGWRYRWISSSYPPGEASVLIRSRRGEHNRVAAVDFFYPNEGRESTDAYVCIRRRGSGTGRRSGKQLYPYTRGGVERIYGHLSRASMVRLARLTGAY